MNKNNMGFILIIVMALFTAPGAAFTETQPEPQKGTPLAAESKGWRGGKYDGSSREELMKLKQENPEKFKQIIAERRQRIKERLEYLKQTDPERYKSIREKIRERRRQRLEKLKNENPEKYKEVMERHKQRMEDRLQKLKAEDPQKYERLMQRRAQAQGQENGK